jgi:hypothetical protein
VSGQRRPARTDRRDPKARLAALALLDRALTALGDDELGALAGGLTEDQRRHLDGLVPVSDGDHAVALRTAATRGRLDGTAEAVAILLTDRVLADCIEQLGEAADLPSAEDLRRVAPGLVERHGLGATRLMLASAVCGEAPATPTLVQLLRHDELLALPPIPPPAKPVKPEPTAEELAERARIKAARVARREQERARKAKQR